MGNLQPDVNVVLIGGSSHAGKSTVSESLAAMLGWEHLSTDRLAAHPGRPWRPAPEKVLDRVAEHYLRLSVDELIEDVLRHYRVIVWPKVEEIVASHSNDASTTGIVLEGIGPVAGIRDKPGLRQGRRVMAYGRRGGLSAENSRWKQV